MDFLIIALGSYFLGSIPFGFILTKIFLKKDIRDIGSGNIGATNALRSGKKSLGFSYFIFRHFKSYNSNYIILNLIIPNMSYIASLSVFLGHVFPIWLKV